MEGQTEKIQPPITHLYNAALKGDVPSLLSLLQEDQFILDRCMIEKSSHFIQSPLHIVTNVGYLEFAIEILRHKPELAEEIDQTNGSSPLHLASTKGHLEIVKALLIVNPNMCFAHDRNGRNPIHVAAINDQIQVLDQLLQANPQAVQERTNSGETVLHLCVKHSRPEALKLVVHVTDDGELLNSKDTDGNTILHLAVEAKQTEIVEFLLKRKKMKKNAINANGSTAMDVCSQSRKDVNNKKIRHSLQLSKAIKAKDAQHHWLDNQSNGLMVVAILIATMAFQVGTNPPGGTWQDNTDGPDGHTAGFSIMADTYHDVYIRLITSNTVGLFSSLTVIILLISGLPCKEFFLAILMITTWIAISATAYTYLQSVLFLSTTLLSDFPIRNTDSLLSYFKTNPVWRTIMISFYFWVLLMLILLFSHVIRIIKKLAKKIMRLGMKLYHICYTKARNHPSE